MFSIFNLARDIEPGAEGVAPAANLCRSASPL
jgi:hypothetical protein